jgi:Spy/CpxP family protein refolding chaperone
VKNILTPAQKAQLQDKRKEMQSKQQDMQKRMADRMKTALNLTAEQSAKLEANHKAMAQDMKKIRENNSLTEQQKREQMMELHKKQKEAMKSILTEEQLQKLKEKRQDHKGGHRQGTEKNKTI